MPQVILYTRPGCGLCEEAEEAIETVRVRRAFEFIQRNILDDQDDYQKYRFEIPVILLDGREIARHHLSPAALDAALDALSSGD